VGEIGIPRREFLYDLRFWEVRRIIRGYRQRDRLKHQLIAECAYAATYAMRDPQGKGVEDIFPMLFDDDDDDEQTVSQNEESAAIQDHVSEMQDMMKNFNKNNTQHPTPNT
jgi:hypothetical protein